MKKSRAQQTDFYVHLVGPNTSGRGVKIEPLSPSTKRKSDADGARIAGSTASMLELRDCQILEGIKRMVRGVTDPDLESIEGADYETVTLADLSTPDSGKSLDEIFTAKDIEILDGVYRQLHEAGALEVQAILGKAMGPKGPPTATAGSVGPTGTNTGGSGS